ncbi:ATP-binding cassette domain-containing protein [Mycolicibacterium sp. BiH015]|uniref:ABC transporter ATP-binding protein n=1 Tax=Mycolicibacterium sp. BiH015 TaxID=3018808 RepID=UPI0022E32CC2|nr:ATP-binding cassette domain-containing protein [Mycolicibacterium sp. BiH015]MDA2891030.1 ATP-binding cassette domain-containing protein [Mycolicibacterium sp. BiH015]
MTGCLFRLENVSIDLDSARGPKPVLRDLTFDVYPHEMVGVVGRSGVGKTTLLKAMGGLIGIDSGTLTYANSSVTAPPAGVVMVFQDYQNALLPWRTAARNVELGLEGSMPRAQRRTRVAHALKMVELSDHAADYPWRLSGGMAQRLQIARALALEPAVLLMDEPFGALDAITKASLQDVLLAVQRQTGTTVVFVTHDLDEAIYLSDRVLVLGGPPGVVTALEDTDLPSERDQVTTRELREYLRLRHVLGETLHPGNA